MLRYLFTAPDRLRPEFTTSQVTEEAAAQLARLAESLRRYGVAPERAAHCLVKLLFCLFAQDIGLLPSHLFTRLVETTHTRSPEFTRRVRALFDAMGIGGSFGAEDIRHFDGGLFADNEALDLASDESKPVLKPLDNIHRRDAILAYDEQGKPVEPPWPEADVIIGNPPFLGGKRLRNYLGDRRVDGLFALYDGRVPREADLVCYWFERSRALIGAGQVKRAGLLATQAIRGGANRRVLERIKETGDLFMAWSGRPWILDGAAVRVSMVGFDGASSSAPWTIGR